MERYNVILDTENNKIESYENILQKFKQYVSFKREIKLTNLLEGKKVKFDVEDINISTQIWGCLKGCSPDIHLNSVSFVVKGMFFVINNGIVEKLTINIKILNTNNGKILRELISSGIELKIKQYFNPDGKISYFYIES